MPGKADHYLDDHSGTPLAHPERLFPTPGLISIGSDMPFCIVSSSELLLSGFRSGLITHQPAGWDREGSLAAN